jgi:hypothetical protein
MYKGFSWQQGFPNALHGGGSFISYSFHHAISHLHSNNTGEVVAGMVLLVEDKTRELKNSLRKNHQLTSKFFICCQAL